MVCCVYPCVELQRSVKDYVHVHVSTCKQVPGGGDEGVRMCVRAFVREAGHGKTEILDKVNEPRLQTTSASFFLKYIFLLLRDLRRASILNLQFPTIQRNLQSSWISPVAEFPHVIKLGYSLLYLQYQTSHIILVNNYSHSKVKKYYFSQDWCWWCTFLPELILTASQSVKNKSLLRK